MFWPSTKIKSVKISREKKQLVAEKKKKAAEEEEEKRKKEEEEKKKREPEASTTPAPESAGQSAGSGDEMDVVRDHSLTMLITHSTQDKYMLLPLGCV